MKYYPILLTIHLFCAILFVGTVFFEVLILENIRKQVSKRFMIALEKAVGNRAVQIMPWTLLLLYTSGIGMVYLKYLPLVHHPLGSSFGLLLTIKIILAISVFGHFLFAMILRSRGKLKGFAYTAIHISVFIHVILIVFLAKNMFYIQLPL